MARSALARGARAHPTHPAAVRRLQRAFRHADLDGDARIASYFDWLDPSAVNSLLSPAMRRPVDADAALLRSLAELPAGLPPLERMLHLERKHFLADHNLNYTDKMSMASGVEVRVPFLDRDLVALAASLPPRLKQRGAQGKWVLKQAMEGILPREVIDRPKTGFGVPLRAWLKGPLRGLVDDVLATDALRRRGWFEPAAVRNLIAADREGKMDAAYPVFAVLCMELWGRIFLDGRALA
jgi:asparagine synthase (glutamine-hydrolysing)